MKVKLPSRTPPPGHKFGIRCEYTYANGAQTSVRLWYKKQALRDAILQKLRAAKKDSKKVKLPKEVKRRFKDVVFTKIQYKG